MQWTLARGGERSCALKSYEGFRAEDVRLRLCMLGIPWRARLLKCAQRRAGELRAVPAQCRRGHACRS